MEGLQKRQTGRVYKVDRTKQVFTRMKPGVWYRPTDLSDDDVTTDCARRVLNLLVRGGVVDAHKEGCSILYITKQKALI